MICRNTPGSDSQQKIGKLHNVLSACPGLGTAGHPQPSGLVCAGSRLTFPGLLAAASGCWEAAFQLSHRSDFLWCFLHPHTCTSLFFFFLSSILPPWGK